MKTVLILSIMSLFLASCKSVDKNPQSCGSDFIKSGSKCVSVDHLLDKKEKSVNSAYYSSVFIGQFIKYNEDRREYSIDTENTLRILNENDPILNYMNFFEKMYSIHEEMKKDLEELRNLRDQSYSGDSYEMVYRLESLVEEAEKLISPVGDLAQTVNDNQGNLSIEEKVDVLKELNKLGADDGGKHPIALFIEHNTSRIGFGISGGLEAQIKFKLNIVKNLKNKVGCTEEDNASECLVELKEKTRDVAYELWLEVVNDIYIQ